MTAVLLTLLKVLAWLLLAVAVLLPVLLLVPVTADALYEKGRVYAGVRVLGIRISLLPRKQKSARTTSGIADGFGYLRIYHVHHRLDEGAWREILTRA